MWEARNPVPAIENTLKSPIDLAPINQSRTVPTLQKQVGLDNTVFIPYVHEEAKERTTLLPNPSLELPQNVAMLMEVITQADIEEGSSEKFVPGRWGDVWAELQIDSVARENKKLMMDAMWEVEDLFDNDVISDNVEGFGHLVGARLQGGSNVLRNYWEAKKRPDWPHWKKAMETQMLKLETAGTWEKVELPEGKRMIPCKWVFDKKRGSKAAGENNMGEESERLETARLVARGDVQLAGVDYGETFAPVVKLVLLHLLLSLAAMFDVDLVHWDVVAAFLNGELEEEVYMRQPPEMDDGSKRALKLKKSIYGLCQSSRVFYLHLDAVLGKLGWKRLRAEWAVWIGPGGKGFIGCHVDDMCVGASTMERATLLQHLTSANLTINELGNITIYVGISVVRNRERKTIKINQATYIEKVLGVFNMSSCNPVATPMLEGDRDKIISYHTFVLTDSEKYQYQRLIGCLLFLVHGTQPDIAYVVIRLSQFAAHPERHH